MVRRRLESKEWLAISLSAVVFIFYYFRLFMSVPLGDESFYVGSALMTSMGGRPFYHELFIQQIASLLFEPIVAVYYFFFGKFAIMLFVRHLYLIYLLFTATLVFRYARLRVDFVSALAIALVIVTGTNFSSPTLSYNSMGCLGFGCFAILALWASEKNSLKLSLWSGFFAFLTMAAYPTLLVGVVALWVLIAAANFHLKRPFLKLLLAANGLTTAVMVAYIASLVLRFGYENIYLSYQFTAAHVSGGAVWPKLAYGWYLFAAFAPWPGFIFGMFFVWLALWRKFGTSWLFFFIPMGLFIVSKIKDRPENGSWAQTFILLGCFSGTVFVVKALRQDFFKNWPMAALWAASLIAVPVLCWTSGMTYYSTHYSAVYGLVAILILASCEVGGRWLPLAMLMVPMIFLYQNWENNFLPNNDENVANLTRVMDWGAFAGIVTYPEQYDHLVEIQKDLDQAAKGAKSVLFYDQFPGGYMMSDLFPMARTWVMHTIGMSAGVRPFIREFYTHPENRPDVFFRFTGHVSPSPHLGVWSVDPKQYLPYKDVFWNYLEDETDGEYVLLIQRPMYAVFKKKALLTP